MRYPTVLFDLDGTVIDSGSIILASMRHATREVLGREYKDGELLAAVGGPGLEAQMHAFDPGRVAELVRVYREHNEPLHEELMCCAGMDDALVRLKEEGRRLGVVTAKRRVTVDLASHRFRSGTSSTRSSAATRRKSTSLIRRRCSSARHGWESSRPTARTSGDSPFDVRAAKRAGMGAIAVTWGGIHARDRLEAEDPDAIVDTAEELLGVL
jgi:pyrophosphatase PpaX